MPATVIIGMQWGDEGKGRAVDSLAAQSDVVARYAGGDNAGHTVNIGEDVFKLHLIPSGILHEGKVCILGGGTVINPPNLVSEMDRLAGMGVEITPDNLMVSTRAHIISPAHVALDKAREAARGEQSIGTTLRGIGPAYLDKTGRQGIRMGEMLDVEVFAETLEKSIAKINETLATMGAELLDPEKDTQAYVDAAARLQPFIKDTTSFINRSLKGRCACVVRRGTGHTTGHRSWQLSLRDQFVTNSRRGVDWPWFWPQIC